MILTWHGQKVYVAGWEPNAPDVCELCKKPCDQLRPFGPAGEYICPQCGDKNPDAVVRGMEAAMKECDIVLNPGKELPKYTEMEMLGLLDEWLLSAGGTPQ